MPRHRTARPGTRSRGLRTGFVALLSFGAALALLPSAVPVTTPTMHSGSNVPRPVAVGASGPTADGCATMSATTMNRLSAGLPPGSVSVAGLNLDTGTRVRYDAAAQVVTASVIKLDILEALLLAHQDDGTVLAGPELGQATAMIVNSDNDAATALWNAVGGHGSGLQEATDRLGADATTTDPNGYWGLSVSDADDQLTLLTNLVDDGPLTPSDRRLALDLMSRVEPDQAWGVSVIADPATTTALKDGWLDIDDDDGRWATGSVGVLTLHGHRVLLAVLTQHNSTEQEGITLVEAMARAAGTTLACS
ncbi:class A beta-lactamase-related serine hydrolase [Pseudonocardia kujensis]|uniref:serine hydrolase n=1 Tax=Pseudonocardia kujensis TaxID=1128675 RepID=UPI001E445BF5|nr:serine hydrolase [Pseudonocardia kujensis]MCE0763266.1 class A beta-lactamase-related serine hydrolase [Pseudonocardia kujensis]